MSLDEDILHLPLDLGRYNFQNSMLYLENEIHTVYLTGPLEGLNEMAFGKVPSMSMQ